jgi:hypothetical protein
VRFVLDAEGERGVELDDERAGRISGSAFMVLIWPGVSPTLS